MAPRASIVCVTNRPAFWPWLAWNIAKQTERDIEVIYVLPRAEWQYPTRRECLVLRLGGTLGEKRQAGLDAATGEVVLHFDDDDWQHPQRVEWSCAVLRAEYQAISSCTAFMVHLETGKAYQHTGAPVHSLAAFRREAVQDIKYPHVDYAEDTRFLQQTDPVRWMPAEHLSFWLVHGHNTSPRPSAEDFKHYPFGLDDVRKACGMGWQDTDEQLEALRCALRGS